MQAARDVPRVVVRAGAGTGKTTTLELVAHRALHGRRALYLAFNRRLAVEAGRRFPDWVQCKTPHAVAYRDIGRQFQDRLGRRIPARVVADRLGLPGAPTALSSSKSIPRGVLVLVARDTVASFCHSAGTTIEPGMVPELPGASEDVHDTLVEVVLPLANRLWSEAPNVDSELPFTHDHYFKLWQLSDPRLHVDTILLDEAQDTNPALMAVLDRQPADVQRIYVGDDAQQIYGWRGAHDALRRLIDTDTTEVLQLTQSWRFGPDVAAYANGLLRALGSPLRLTGHPDRDSTVGPAHTPGTRLCRTNGQLITELMSALQDGTDVAVVGDTEGLQRLATAAGALQSGRRAAHHTFALFQDWDEVRDYSQSRDGGDLRPLVDAIDDHGVDQIQQALGRIASRNTDDAELLLSTAHRSKGGEWDTVTLADDYPTPEGDGTGGDEDAEDPDHRAGRGGQGGAPVAGPFVRQLADSELMLLYVACTRARQHLDPGDLDRWLNPYLQHEGHPPANIPRRPQPGAPRGWTPPAPQPPTTPTPRPPAQPDAAAPSASKRPDETPPLLPAAAIADVTAAVETLVASHPGLLARVAIADCLCGEATGNRRGLDTARHTTHWGALAHLPGAALRPTIDTVIVQRLDDGRWTTTDTHTITPAGTDTRAPEPDPHVPTARSTAAAPPDEPQAPAPTLEIADLVTALEKALARAEATGEAIRPDIGPRLRRASRLATPRSRRIRRTVPRRTAPPEPPAEDP